MGRPSALCVVLGALVLLLFVNWLSSLVRGGPYTAPPSSGAVVYIYAMANEPRHEWQAQALEFSMMLHRQPGHVIRCIAPHALYPNRPVPVFERPGETLVMEDYSRLAAGCLGALQPGSVLEVTRRRLLSETTPVVLLDVNMLFTRQWSPDVRPGLAVGQRWAGYTAAFCRATSAPPRHELCPKAEQDALVLPVALAAGELHEIAEEYMAAFLESPCRWRADRTALVLALQRRGCATASETTLCVCGDWPNADDPAAPLVNYRQPIFSTDGERLWNKEEHVPGAQLPDPALAGNRVGRETLRLLKLHGEHRPQTE